ncbi:MAG: hypothetical protein C5B43_01400 [Verrucomicrobia bacterium]|nr:MAG: hypothetical protein C5B43_01400 [Verrucomicrobiota bacterium]
MERESIPKGFKSLLPEIEKEIEVKIKPDIEDAESHVRRLLLLLGILAFLLSIFFVKPKLKRLVHWIGGENTASVG